MEDHFIPVFFFTVLVLLLSHCAAIDTISTNQALIDDGKTIVSEAEIFELGFFSPGNSKNRYLGIWYKKVAKGTVVWVANRQTPITDNSGMLKVSSDGNQVVLCGTNNMVWSSNSTGVFVRRKNPAVEVQLLDTGNLVVWDKSSTNQNLIWQSFDYPGDTILPGMKLGKDLVTGLERIMTSWKSPDDPSIGLYSNIVDTNGYPQTFGWKGQVLASRLGPWNGIGYSGFPIDKENGIYSDKFVVNDKEIYHKYELKSPGVHRVVLTWDGKTQIMQWIVRIKDWIVYGDLKVDICDRFALCGPYGICGISNHPPCNCMRGFEPKTSEEWDASDWSGGCKRKHTLVCRGGDGFWKITGVKVPDTRRSWYNVSMTLRECEMACRRNCSCTAYGSLDIRNGGSGCLLWFDELLDVREYDEDHDIYIRVAASELQGHMASQFGFVSSRRKGVLIMLLLIPSVLLLLCVLVNTCKNKKKRLRAKWRGDREYVLNEKNTSLHMEHLDELESFSLYKVAEATGNFSVSNKIGQGGFGPVYKGVLEDGREVAVKRLSEKSHQGLDEFKNEIICITKLQHRNLVKLLGYCIKKNELILIYEYMTNKSLDSFLYDETRSLMLDWPKRFHIIHGMARGILYLHQDSRLQIIHRDLKPGNILLDGDMNPKISDFGLARKFEGKDATARTMKVAGTYGYIAPEYALHGHFSIKSDVFSFGVLVLEIVSGKKNREYCYDQDHRDNLLGHAWRLYKENKAIELMSASLQDSCVVSELLRSIHVALLCVQNYAKDRPTMLSVVLMLVSESALPEPKQPAFFTEFTEQSSGQLNSLPSVNECTITLLHAR